MVFIIKRIYSSIIIYIVYICTIYTHYIGTKLYSISMGSVVTLRVDNTLELKLDETRADTSIPCHFYTYNDIRNTRS